MEQKIVSPHQHPDEARAEKSRHNMLFSMLKKDLPPYAERCVETSKAMQEQLRLIYIDGMSDALSNWAKFAESKAKFIASASQLVEELNKWEKEFINWQTSIHGEAAVKEIVNNALKGKNNV